MAVLALVGIVCAVVLTDSPAPAPTAAPSAVVSAAVEDSAESTPEPALSPCTITLNGDSVEIDGPGAKAAGSTVTITQNGDYYLSGTLEDGQIIVEAGKDDDNVHLHLNGADITCKTSAPIYVKQAGLVYIETEPDTENFIADTENYVFAEGEDEPDAAIFSKDDLYFIGTGSLTVSGSYDMAIHGKDMLSFNQAGTYAIRSKGDGIKGKDSVAVQDVSMDIQAGEDGIQSNNDQDPELGVVTVSGGCELLINAGKDGIRAESRVDILDSDNISIHAEEDGIHCTRDVEVFSGRLSIISQQDGIQADGNLRIPGGAIGLVTGGGADNGPEHTEDFGPPPWFQNADTDESVSAKGLKSDGDITISGGSITIDSMDDAVHCAGTLTVSKSADITIETGDDGFHSDDTLTIEGGRINILRSYEGLEAVYIKISGGDTTLVASDDGLNAAGGTTADTDFPFMGPPGMGGEPETLEDATYYVHITGGKLSVDAGGDGLDSNGAMFIDGGEIYVSGPAGTMNGGLDYTTTGQINGGTVVVTEITSMAENFDSSSTQVSFRYGFSTTFEDGTRVTLTDDGGKTLVDATMAKRFNSVTISTPELEVGKTYTLTCGEESVEVELTDTISTLGTGGPGGGPGGGGPGGGPGGMPGGGPGGPPM